MLKMLLFISMSLYGAEEPPPFPETAEGEGRFFYEFLYMLLILALMIAVMVAASWLIKRMLSSRMQGTNLTNDIKVLEQRGISTKSSLYLVEVYGERFLLGESQSGITSLGKISVPQEKV